MNTKKTDTSSESAEPVVVAPTPSAHDVAPRAIGTRVKINKGPWAGVVGVVDRLTSTVGGGRTTIVKADAPPAGEKDIQYLPKTRLVVVENRFIELAPKKSRRS